MVELQLRKDLMENVYIGTSEKLIYVREARREVLKCKAKFNVINTRAIRACNHSFPS